MHNKGDNGFRVIGQRKFKLITKADDLIRAITAAGVNMKHMKKLYGINKSPLQIPTKNWSGVIGELKQFARDNGIQL